MKEKFIIQGQKTLEGEIEVRGSKNAAAANIAAVLLTEEECIIDNLPLVKDILNLIDILKDIKVEVKWISERKVKLKAGKSVDPSLLDFKKFSKARTSVLLIGALLPRFKEFKASKPGGDKIGLRPITTHLRVLKKMGVDVKEEGGFYYFKADQLTGTEIVLPEFSVTATENLLMVSVLAKGETTVKMAASEPNVQDLALMLIKMGAEIKGVGTHTLKIKGKASLKGVEHSVIPDPVEAGTFIVIGALTRGRVLVKNVNVEHLDSFLERLAEIGVQFKKGDNTVEVFFSSDLKAVKIQALPYPGFPTDLLPLVVPLLTQAKGKSLIHDPLYENRLNYVNELRKMGSDIEIVDPHRAFVLGKTPLHGVTIKSWDIRAGASLIVAGLMAEGETVINDIHQIDRGYEKIEERLALLGADIKRT